MSSDPGPNDRSALTTWKDIAQHFDRDVRTVQRWEKEEGLPVHRHIHQRKSSVYAYADELQKWWLERGVMLAEPQPTPATEASPHASNVSIARLVAASLLVLAAVTGLAYVVSTAAMKNHILASSVASVSLRGNTLVALDKSGDVSWTYKFPQSPGTFTGAKIIPGADIGSGARVLTAMVPETESQSLLLLFSPDGKMLWNFRANDTLLFGRQSFGAPWRLREWGSFEIAGERKFLAALAHHTWWPSQLVMLDEQGQIAGRFVNSGWIANVERTDGPLGPLLLAGGANNARDAGMIAVLDAKNISGSSPENAGSLYECKNCPAGRPLKYFVFPRSELNRATGSTYNFANAAANGRQIVMQTWENDDVALDRIAAGVYEFSTDLQLLRASYSDRYWELHRKLELEGKIKHSKAQCPDQKGPRSLLAWDPQNGWKEIRPN
ncbi:MAG: hypothetical protein M1453_02525 [Acidobacteria bacterium]|nr:hypothetical protein [Acidobacteriota bacterium]MCL5286859.1 hypothetical protein [Acidobacteriota bacterium]